MSESTTRTFVVRFLTEDGLDAVAVENPACPGTPDVNYVEGWIELKQLTHWPKTTGPVQIRHFRQGQRIWLRRRWAAGGAAWFLLRVRTDWLLFDGEYAGRMVGLVSREELYRNARATWSNTKRMREELSGCLSRPRT